MNNFRSLRITTEHSLMPLIDEILNIEGFEIEKVSFYSKARVAVGKKNDIGNSILNRFGQIYIQDLSSMLPPLLLLPKKGSIVLDMCASPGGKSAILSELIGEHGVVVANEPVKKRYITLRKNIERLNLFNIITTSYKGEEFPENFQFDYVLLDVPCSGWGTKEKNPKVLKLWQGKRLEPLIKLQRELIKKGFRLLKPGGRLIYSTCTTNIQENQNQIKWALKNLCLELVPLNEVESFEYEHSNSIPGTLAIRGHRLYSQGFFIACLQKKENDKVKNNVNGSSNCLELIDNSIVLEGFENVGLSLDKLKQGFFYVKNKIVYYSPIHFDTLKYEGIQIGTLKQKGFYPSTNLWKLMNKHSGNVLEINDLNQIKRLVCGESIFISNNFDYMQLFYRDIPLCLLQVKGNRCLITR